MKAKENENRRTPWNITQLAYELHNDLKLCTSKFEEINCTAIYTKEIRELRDTITASGRKLTPGECATLEYLGIGLL